ncbi:uncharacterized protein LOC101238575 [Hydra vulgaris]|uniref:uncharacterized protein LOC101238575 n=1 Tax=Hydra vulgaris TaxID=6087 RepID=UPI0002B450CC|nr:uncharacterized protein LOC101238575 [Hydra vulgaris]
MSRKAITYEDRVKVVHYHQEGKTAREIGRIIKRSHSSVLTIIKRFRKTKSYIDRHRSGRPRLTTPNDDRLLIRLAKKNRTMSLHELRREWKLSNGCQASPSLVRRKLIASNMLWKKAVLKPRLNKQHIKKRKEFCQSVKEWSKEKWRTVMFSDDMNIEVDNRKNRISQAAFRKFRKIQS